MEIIKNVSEPIKGALLIVAGLSLLFHTLGILQEFFYYALLVISAYLVIVGFIKIGGFTAVKVIIKKKDKDDVIVEEKKED
ncbi:hypothetical protein ACFLYA_01775 [Candidatus Dependentiae bacterium]